VTETTKPQFAAVEVQLVGLDGNIFGIIGRVQRELRRSGLASKDEINDFAQEVMSTGSYAEALHVVGEWVTVT
jgi:hypothetical protein